MRKRRAPTDADGGSVLKGTDAVDQDTTGSYTEATSLLFDPNRVLLRRVFFLDPDKTRYISVGYYPSRYYQPLVEIGSPKVRPILLTDQHVKTLAEHLPAQVDALWRDEFHNVRDGKFATHSAPPYKTAILALGEKEYRKSVFLKLPELRYLTYIFPIVQNQLITYTEAMADLMNYVLTTINSITYIAPSPTANINIPYSQLFEEKDIHVILFLIRE